MADIRALMAQERQARRINHEFASYTKTGALTCTACQLNIKSDTLWDGHLRSTNHKNNVKKLHEATRIVAKRKIEDVDEIEDATDADARKKLKPKNRTLSQTAEKSPQDTLTPTSEGEKEDGPVESISTETQDETSKPLTVQTLAVGVASSVPAQQSTAVVDEDEWAAFERDIASLAQPDYSAATITAAPVSAAQLEAEAEADRKKLRDTEADDEKEDEGRRIEEEFEVMEEMEERVRRLKEKREALRSMGQAEVDTGQPDGNSASIEISTSKDEVKDDIDDSDDDEDVDDWYS